MAEKNSRTKKLEEKLRFERIFPLKKFQNASSELLYEHTGHKHITFNYKCDKKELIDVIYKNIPEGSVYYETEWIPRLTKYSLHIQYYSEGFKKSPVSERKISIDVHWNGYP